MAEAALPLRQLDLFEDHAVSSAGIEIPGAAGGLREALATEPRQFRIGETVRVLMELSCTKVRFEPTDKKTPDSPLRRVHVMKVAESRFA